MNFINNNSFPLSMKRVASAVVIKDKKLLIVKKNETWILPGGKINPGETDLECLARELSEELKNVSVKSARYYDDFDGVSPHRKDSIRVTAYLTTIDGEPSPSAEIKEVKWVSDFTSYPLSEVTQQIVNSLKEEGRLV